VSEQNRKFNSNREERYFFANNKGKPQCIARMQVVSVPKEFLFKKAVQYQTRETIQEIPRKF